MQGLRILPGYLDDSSQRHLLDAIAEIVAQAPFQHYRTPGGQSMSVAMSNAGPLGWFTDRAGYRYIDRHPTTGQAWPPIPPLLLTLWQQLADYPAPPESCLINHYAPTARMGLHRDQDEIAATAPILNVSLGDTALFRLGGLRRNDPTHSFQVPGGTVMLFTGPARQAFHGVDRITAGSARIAVPWGGRINLTLRRVTMPATSYPTSGSVQPNPGAATGDDRHL